MSAAAGLSSLWLPLEQRRSVWLACCVLFVAYLASMSFDLSYYDSSELALAAVVLGLGHPPGQPLHTLLGFGLSQLPGLAPLAGVALASAIPGALALVPTASLAQTLLGSDEPRWLKAALPWLLCVLGLHASLWEPATRVEVYPLATFFALWAVAKLAAPASSSEGGERRVLCAAIALGLCASSNPMIAICTALALAPSILTRVAQGSLALRALLLAALGGCIGLLPYLYVPLVAQRSDVLVWGAPRTAQSLWSYLTLQEYAHNRAITLPLWLSHAFDWTVDGVRRAIVPWLALGAAGHLLAGSRAQIGRFSAPIAMFLLIAVTCSYVVWSLEVPDYDGYHAAGLWLGGAGTPALLAIAHQRLRARSELARVLVIAVLLALSVASLLSPPALLARTRHRDHVARRLAERVLDEAPARAIVITHVDAFAASLLYLQEAEHKRPDVVVLAYGLASSSWHWERIFALHPGLEPFALKGPGGRAARVKRFADAQATRPVRIESLGIAQEIGLSACAGGVYLRAGRECESTTGGAARTEQPASELFARALAEAGTGSPSAVHAVSAISFSLGESLWRLGEPELAYATLLSGVPRELWPVTSLAAPAGLEHAAALARPLPAFRRPAALGDPARNLFAVGLLLASAKLEAQAEAFVRAAAREELPEALALVQR